MEYDKAVIMPKNTQSISEKKLIAELVNVGLYPKPQYKISEMHVDLAFPEKMIVVEIDGPHHASRQEKDESRDYELTKRGWKVLRYSSNDAHNHSVELAEKIKAEYDNIGNNSKTKIKDIEKRARNEKTEVQKIAYEGKINYPWKLILTSLIIGLILLLILNKFGG